MRIDGVDLFRYAGPRPAGTMASACGLVVRLRAAGGGAVVTGLGEAVATNSQAADAWRHLRRVAANVAGSVLPEGVDPANPLQGIGGWRAAGELDRGSLRAAKLAVEMALLDLLAKAGGRSWAGLWGVSDRPAPVTPVPTVRLPGTAPGPAGGRIARELGDDPGRSWAVRLRSTGDPDLDVAWLSRVAQIERAAGRDRAVWLVGADLEPGGASRLVRGVAELLAGDGFPSRVLVEEPIRRQRRSASRSQLRPVPSTVRRRALLSELQQLADATVGHGRSGGAPRVSVVAGDSVGTVTQVRRLCQGWPVGGLHLSLQSWGTLVGLREGARVAKQADPATLVLLGDGRGSQLTATALRALAAATPECDRYVLERAAGGWPKLVVEKDEAPGGCGLFAGIDLGELSAVVDGTAKVPEEPPALDCAEEPNRFPDYSVPVGSWDARLTSSVEIEMLRSGLRTIRFSNRLLLADQPGSPASIGFDRVRSSMVSVPGCAIAGYKGVAREVLAAQGLPVAAGASFPNSEVRQAHQAGLELGFPLVVKPGGGTMGIGVTTGIASEEELRHAIEAVAASRYRDSGIVVERHVPGNDYRVLATRTEVLSLVRREPASVTGDGRRSVEELVVGANAVRARHPILGKLPVPLDAQADDLLARQGLTRRSVPGARQRVYLRTVANLSQGGDSYEVLDSTHPSVCELAVAAVRAIPGLPYAGVDILMDDHRSPVDSQNLAIIEVNSVPGVTLHHFPVFGPPRDASAPLVRSTAVAAGLQLTHGADRLAVRLTALGRVQDVGYRQWISRLADQLGVYCAVESSPEPDQFRAVLRGTAPHVAEILRLAFMGPPKARVLETRVEPLDPVDPVAPPRSPSGQPSAPVRMADAVVRVRDTAAGDHPHDVPARRSGRNRERLAGSAVLEGAARRLGMEVRRYERGVVICEGGPGRASFRGLSGMTSGAVAAMLCRNDWWLRRFLAGRGLPVRATRVVDHDLRAAREAAESLGFPVAVRLSGGSSAAGRIVAGHAALEAAFEEVWQQLPPAVPETGSKVILERPVTGRLVEMAVVGGEVVAVEIDGPEHPGDQVMQAAGVLAGRAIDALPGCEYGSVRMVVDPGPGAVVIDAIDPSLDRWAVLDDACGPAVADAVLRFELDRAGPAS